MQYSFVGDDGRHNGRSRSVMAYESLVDWACRIEIAVEHGANYGDVESIHSQRATWN